MMKKNNYNFKMKIKINKKATISASSVLSIWDILMIVFVIFAVIFLISGALLKNIDSRDSQSRVYALVPLYSTSGISYYDEDLQRLIVGTIDMKKFNDQKMENSMSSVNNEKIAAKFTLYNANDMKEIKSAYYNKVWYERWEPISGFTGNGGVQSVITERYVILKNSEDSLNNAILKIEVLTPNG